MQKRLPKAARLQREKRRKREKSRKPKPAAKREGTTSCFTCSWSGSRRLAHDHHIVPKKAGGGDGPSNKKWLCSGCHNNIHAIASAFIHRREQEAIDLLHSCYPLPVFRERAGRLAQIIASRMLEQIDSGGPEEHTVMILVPDREFRALQAIARDSRLSVANLLRGLGKREIRAQGTALKGTTATLTAVDV